MTRWRRLKAFGVAVISLFKRVEIKGKKGRAWIDGAGRRFRAFLSLFYDVRRRRSGKTWIQLRQRR
jgi:hypothetical protein